jgi:hypothetical protein
LGPGENVGSPYTSMKLSGGLANMLPESGTEVPKCMIFMNLMKLSDTVLEVK